ncbi:unnamed protein product, partial [Phaeothamnion confervicola]
GGGYFGSRCKAEPARRRKIAAPAVAGPGCLPTDRPLEGRGRRLSDGPRSCRPVPFRKRPRTVLGAQAPAHVDPAPKSADVLGNELGSQPRDQAAGAEMAQVVIEVAQAR